MAIRKILTVAVWDEREAAEGELVLRVGTGPKGSSAFGFGSHDTTSACLSVICGLYGDRAPKPQRVLDVGCGTGVLGIAAARLGAAEVLGVDIDPACVAASVENAALNGVADCCRFALTPAAEVAGEWALVIANIPAPLIMNALLQPLCDRARGGKLLVSGFKEPQREAVIAKLEEKGRKLRAEIIRGDKEWCALLFN